MTDTPVQTYHDKPLPDMSRMELFEALTEEERAAESAARWAASKEQDLHDCLASRSTHRKAMEALAAELAGRFRPARCEPGAEIRFADGTKITVDTVAWSERGTAIIRGRSDDAPTGDASDECPPHGMERPEETVTVDIEMDTERFQKTLEGAVGGGGTAADGDITAATWHIPQGGTEVIIHVGDKMFAIAAADLREVL